MSCSHTGIPGNFSTFTWPLVNICRDHVCSLPIPNLGLLQFGRPWTACWCVSRLVEAAFDLSSWAIHMAGFLPALAPCWAGDNFVRLPASSDSTWDMGHKCLLFLAPKPIWSHTVSVHGRFHPLSILLMHKYYALSFVGLRILKLKSSGYDISKAISLKLWFLLRVSEASLETQKLKVALLLWVSTMMF